MFQGPERADCEIGRWIGSMFRLTLGQLVF